MGLSEFNNDEVNNIDVKYKNNIFYNIIKTIFNILRVVVIGLIISAGLILFNKNNFIDWFSYFIFIVSLYIFTKYRVNPILLIVINGIIGIINYKLI